MAHLGFILDPLAGLNPGKDTTLALIAAANRLGHHCYALPVTALSWCTGQLGVRGQLITGERVDALTPQALHSRPISDFQAIWLRQDPPFDREYAYLTQLLEHAQRLGVRVVNDPRSVRDWNEKLAILHFTDCMAATCVSRDSAVLMDFIQAQGDVILKPLDGMGGRSIFRTQPHDPNLRVILETLAGESQRSIMAQAYLPAIVEGDKRILMLHGEPLGDMALARIPQAGENRGNLAAGGRAEARPLTEADRHICQRVGPELKQRGLFFVGLDVIGDRLTEINVTSPTCLQELDRAQASDLATRSINALCAGLD